MAKAYTVIGLGYGDEGKGTIVDFLTRNTGTHTVVRYNGGPQAAHHVVLPDGRFHCFAQFGAGSLAGAKTHLSRGMLIKLQNLEQELGYLAGLGYGDALRGLSADPECALVTPWHAMLCRMEEVGRGAGRHGSVGMGVGKAARDRSILGAKMPRMRDLENASVLLAKLEALWDRCATEAQLLLETENSAVRAVFSSYRRWHSPQVLAGALLSTWTRLKGGMRLVADEESVPSADSLVLEGAQGILLDPVQGFAPWVTKTDVGLEQASAFLDRASFEGDAIRVGILRAYCTRHGAGPFVTHDEEFSSRVDEPYNLDNEWQGSFRSGHFDLPLARYALSCAGEIDVLALTCLDRFSSEATVKVCTAYEYCGDPIVGLDACFNWERRDGKIRVHRITPRKDRSDSEQQLLATLLMQCKPLEWKTFEPWTCAVGEGGPQLPPQAETFISFLESHQGLDTPIQILSCGPTHQDKIWRR